MDLHLLTVLLSLLFLWIGSGIAVSGVNKISQGLKKSSFLISFFVLGLFTSLSEISVAVNASIDGLPQIAVGNLLGGIIVMFLLIIPFLGLIGNGIYLKNSISNTLLLACLAFLFIPFLFILDQKLSFYEGGLTILFYIVLSYFLFKNSKNVKELPLKKKPSIKPITLIYSVVLILTGIATLFIASDYLLKEIIYFARVFNTRPILLSFVLLSLGTNLPEIAIGIRSLLSGNKDVAFGNYIGSAVFNPFILGLLTMYSGEINISISLVNTFIFTIFAFTFFFYFSRSENTLSRSESFMLLVIYFIFLFFELVVLI
jgi:cation:H+ antiporter